MDINSLLSPSEAPSRASTATASPRNSNRRRAPTSAATSAPAAGIASQHQQPAALPTPATSTSAAAPTAHQQPGGQVAALHHKQLPAHIQIPPPISPSRHGALHQQQQQQWSNMPSPAGSNFSATGAYSPRSYTHSQNAMGTPPPMERSHSQQRPPVHRAPTSGMDTLADLASMQQHQQTSSRPNIPHRQNSAPNTNSSARPNFQRFRSVNSGSRGSIDLSMLDSAPKPRAAQVRSLSSVSLTTEELKAITQLFQHLHDNSHAYQSHLQLTRLLRKGLRKHTLDEATGQVWQDPRRYELVRELNEANEAMGKLFAIGEELWLERLYDQELLAHSVEDCVAVMESLQKAVSEEAGSTTLWQKFGDWVSLLHRVGHGLEADIPPMLQGRFASWSSDDKAVAREIFSRKQLVEVWRRGSQETLFNMRDSHLIWDNYIALLLEDIEKSQTDQGLVAVRELFEKRLQVPHKEWEQTFQHFSQFVSRHLQQGAYEQTMTRARQASQLARLQYDDRDRFESRWHRAVQAGDQQAEGQAVSEYLDWELGRSKKKKGHFSLDFCRSLYQRALLRFPLYADLWEAFVLFLADETPAELLAQHMLPAIDRATKHCPWSGKLWGHYIRTGELVKLSFDEMSQIKHKATSEGLLDASSLDDHIHIYTNWCSYLRRSAFAESSSSEEKIDTTEVGIRSAMEDVEIIGRQRHGKEYSGDPICRLERIYIRFCTQVGDGVHIQTARDQWTKLVTRCGKGHEFWLWYFLWERFIWAKHAGDTKIPVSPRNATNVLIQGIAHPDIDLPEKLIDYLLWHAEDYEDPAGQLRAIVAAQKARKAVEKRRALEAQQKAEADQYQQQQALQASVAQSEESDAASVKRKRETIEGDSDTASKKARSAEVQEDVTMADADEASAAQPKRDRENATIVVKNLPASVSEGRVRHFFRDCGKINGMRLVATDGKPDDPSTTAHIEFDSSDDVQAARTRDMKSFEGRSISVQVGTGTTIYCANYPAVADETYIRSLFEPFGKVLEIRFPSLRYNTHRRFCYVQFQTDVDAQAATAGLDGKELAAVDGEAKLRLVAKISDPGHKQSRSGALEEGRELYIGNLDWGVTEDELQTAFKDQGSIESVRIPQNMSGKSKGMAFIVFQTSDQAKKALTLDGTKLRSRNVTVNLATRDRAKRTATTLIGKARSTGSPSPSVADSAYGAMETDLKAAQKNDGGSTQEEIASRTIALLEVPDTVNDARIRAIAEPHGSLAKIVLRPDHGGAIVEFVETAGAGKASMALENYEITPGRAIRVGTVSELLSNKGERKSNAPVKTGQPAKASGGGLGSGVVRRPGQSGGRRGGLGVKRGGGSLLSAHGKKDTPTTDGNGEQTGSKSNDDFRALLSKGKGV